MLDKKLPTKVMISTSGRGRWLRLNHPNTSLYNIYFAWMIGFLLDQSLGNHFDRIGETFLNQNLL